MREYVDSALEITVIKEKVADSLKHTVSKEYVDNGLERANAELRRNILKTKKNV